MTSARLILTSLALLATGASPAAAATAEVELAETSYGPTWQVTYVAAPGERNVVTTWIVDDYSIRVQDAGAAIAAGRGCRSLAPGEVECSNARLPRRSTGVPYLYTLGISAGDRDDSVRSTGTLGPMLHADGGPGSDVLEGAEGMADELDGGGGGHDRLYGRGNTDTLRDGDVGGAADADVLDGGDDIVNSGDVVTYATRTAPVAVDLEDGEGGEKGEVDELRGIGQVIGGAGDDTLTGTAWPNTLTGGPGDDHLDGLGGRDSLHGDSGSDRLHGHAGDDHLEGGLGGDEVRGDDGDDDIRTATRVDRVSCGEGVDRLVRPTDRVRVAPSCDALLYGFHSRTGARARPEDEQTSVRVAAFPVTRSRTLLRFSVHCPIPADADCGWPDWQAIELFGASGRLLGAGRLDERRFRRPGSETYVRTARIPVRLTARGRSLLARRTGAVTTVRLRSEGLAPVRWVERLSTR